MEIKKITEGITGQEAANIIYENDLSNATSLDRNLRVLYGDTSSLASQVNTYVNQYGQKSSSDAWACTPFIPVSALKKVVTMAGNGTISSFVPAVSFYTDADYSSYLSSEYASSEEKTGTGSIYVYRGFPNIPASANFVVINVFKLYINDFILVGDITLQSLYLAQNYLIEGSLQNVISVIGYAKNDGTLQLSGSWLRSQFLSVDLFTKVSNLKTAAGKYTSVVPAIAYYSEANENSFISLEYTPANAEPTGNSSVFWYNQKMNIPVNAKYLIINCFAQLVENTREIKEGDIQKLSDRVTTLENETGGLIKVIKVKKTPGNNEYSTISEALTKAVSGDVIYIFEGIYEEYGLVIPNGVSLIGVGFVTIKGELPVTATTVQVDASATIDFFNNGKLENLTITAKNMRYPVHSDFSQGNTKQEIVNCRFIHYGNYDIWKYRTDNDINFPNDAANIFRAVSAWGAGTRGGDKRYFKGCYFESNLRAFSTHNNTDFNTTYGASITILEDCEMISHGIDRDGTNLDFTSPVVIQSLISNSPDTVILSNCKINGFLAFQNACTFDIRSNSKGLKTLYNSLGSGKSMLNQVNVVNTSVYPRIAGELNAFKNVGVQTIPKGCAVKKNNQGIELMTSSDNTNLFFGVAMQDIETNKCGDVTYAGYLLRPYLKGLNSTINEGDSISVTNTGAFIVDNSAVVAVVVDNENILIK